MHTRIQRALGRTLGVLGLAPRSLQPARPHNTPGWLSLPLLAGLVISLAPPFARAQTSTFNYAEALQKSLYFYDAEKSGPGITGGRLEWRGDSDLADQKVPLVPKGAGNVGTNLSQAFINANRAILDPDGDGFVDVSGGYHDAGDHVRFGLPQSYAASTLAWGLYEFPDAFAQSGQRDHMIEILRWYSDCFLRSTFRDASGNIVAFCYQVGEGAVDHTYWGPPELQSPTLYPRPAYFATAETPASDQAAGHAAALAAIGLVLQKTDAAYSARCIDTAKALYRFAVANRGLGYSGGFYGSSFDEDELSWAATWLLTATGNTQYLTDIESLNGNLYTGYLKRIIASTGDNWQNIWVHSWDTVWGGVFMRLAEITNNPKYMYYARWNVEYWSGVPHQDPTDNNFMVPTPAGFRVINTWGSARYNCAAQLCALIMRKITGRVEFSDWARGQMDYIMGKNPMNRSYIVGFPTPAAAAQHPHHRAAHGSMTNSMLDPATHRHVLWGALVGGPDSKDIHNDVTTDFVSNEVAVDYNAGLVGALAGLYTYYGQGQQPLAAFPPLEPAGQPYFAEAKLEQENTERTQVTIRPNAAPLHPPHFERGLSARYFFDISELIAAGQSISDVRIEIYYDQEATLSKHPAIVRGPTLWDGGSVYYVEFDWTGADIFGTREIQFGLIANQDSHFKSNWNPTNDYSRQGLTSTYATTQHVTLYRNGALIFGTEPPSSQVPNYSVSASPATLTVMRGATATSTINIARTGGFAGAVDLSVSGLPSGVTASFSADPTTGATRTLTLTASSTAVAGASTLTINGVGTPGTRSATVNLTVTQPAASDFSVSASPAVLTINQGATGTSTIAITRVGGFTGAVDLTATGLPAGVTAAFSPASTTGNTSTLTLTASNTAAAGAASITINGTSTTGTRSASLTLTVAKNATSPCANPTAVTLPFTQNGAGEFCFVTSGNVTFINSWNAQLIEINGVAFTNVWSNNLPAPINGNYYIHYVSTTPWAHFEMNGSGGTTTNIPATGVTVSPATLSLVVGTSSTLTATVAPANATSKTVTWQSANPAVATVSATGVVSAVTAGSTTITATTQSGGFKASTAVTVTAPTTNVAVSGVSVSPTTASVSVGGTTTLTATVTPANATNPAVAWTSSNPAIATVNASGVVSGVAAGNATVTATTQSGGLTASAAISVTGGTTTASCTSPTAATLPLMKNGAADVCLVTSGTVSFINSWNMQLVEINGVAFTNKWANSLPPRINGNYYIHYVATVPWAHLEVNGSP